MAELNTYGDLKKLISGISKRQKGEKILSKGKEFALDQILGLIPGASNAKTAFDFISVAIKKPDTKKTSTWLDKLDVDDEMSAIVDDTVESGFMQSMVKSIESEPNDKPLEDDFNMNQKMVNYLKEKYKNRTVTGISENMKEQKLRERIREEVSNILKEEEVVNIPSNIKTLLGKLEGIGDETLLFNALKKAAEGEVKDLQPKQKEMLANAFISLIKNDDAQLTQKLFQAFKKV
jgi:hypothetical protein